NQVYGYSPVTIDLTDHLTDGANVLAVRVDRTRIGDSRWYTGSGIYRDVDLVCTGQRHVSRDGIFAVATVASSEIGKLAARVRIENHDSPTDATLKLEVRSDDGEVVAKGEVGVTLPAGISTAEAELQIDQPRLWDIDHPHLYHLTTALVVGGESIDQVETVVGFRSFRFDAEEGFFLNGRRVPIRGVCLHHDAGLVGAAVPDGVWERRLRKLMEGGVNAIRTAHNPPSAAFLDLCDRLGLLVQHEFFDEWDKPKDKRLNCKMRTEDHRTEGYSHWFDEHARDDLRVTMLRDRNHPCLFMWSIGNEIEWCYDGYHEASGYWEDGDDINQDGWGRWSKCESIFTEEQLAEAGRKLNEREGSLTSVAQKLADWTRELDTSRPVTANMVLPIISYFSGYAQVQDVAGMSYRMRLYDRCHRWEPDLPIIGNENKNQWFEWEAVEQRPFVSGVFTWTGIDYMGEANGKWPKKASCAGMLDLAGFEKPSFHVMRAAWADKPVAKLFTQPLAESRYDEQLAERTPGAWRFASWTWYAVKRHWNYQPEEPIVVEVYSNEPELELMLNGESLGRKSLSSFEDRVYRWLVPYQPGTLTLAGGQDQLETSGEPVGLRVEVDRTELPGDGRAVSHAVIQLVDAEGRDVTTQDVTVDIEVEGALCYLGVDNGALDNLQPYYSTSHKTRNGRCLVIVQATKRAGEGVLRLASDGLAGASASIQTVTP
ncbi:MAG: glycoside hydrolase family 2 TIM barrel-domain containing protein, partial [Planctomycetota bacterium]